MREDGGKARLLIAFGPDDDAVVVTGVVKKGQVLKGKCWGAIEVADVLRLIAVDDRDEELCGRGKELPSSIKDAQLKLAHASPLEKESTARDELPRTI